MTPEQYIELTNESWSPEADAAIRAIAYKHNYDPKYKPWQEPPFPKAEVPLVISVICKHFLHICMYYGYQTWEWHTPNWESDAIEFARTHDTFKSHAEYISTYLQDFKPVA